MRLPALASLLLLAGCGHAGPRPVHVATTAAGQAVAGGVTLLLPPRLCVDVQMEEVRRPRAGRPGLERTSAVAAELVRQKLAAGAIPTTRGCRDAVDLEEPELAFEVRPAPLLLARMAHERASRAIVAEVGARILCMPTFDEDEVLDRCVEDEVTVSALVFDAAGRPVHVATVAVDDAEDAAGAVRALRASFAHGAAGSAAVGGVCRFVGEQLDCT